MLFFINLVFKTVIMSNKFSLYVLLLVFFASCSKNELIELENEEQEETVQVVFSKPSISADKNTINIYDPVILTLKLPEDFFMNDRFKDGGFVYWTINGVRAKKKLVVVDKGNNVSKIAKFWSHSFYFPGKYTMAIVGEEKGKEIVYDSLIVNVQNRKDFANLTWDDIYANRAIVSNWFTNDFYQYDFRPKVFETDGQKYIQLFPFLTNPNVSTQCETGVCSGAKEAFINYMKTLYGVPVYNKEIDGENKSEIIESFKALKEDSNQEVLFVWLTSSSQMALIRYTAGINKEVVYKVHVEAVK